MRCPNFRSAIQPFWLIATCLCLAGTADAQVNVLTSHNDNARTGLNSAETLLTHTNVNAQQFGKLFTIPVDGNVYAQPLYVGDLVVPGKGTHDVVFVATEHNSVYAFDADSSTGPNAPPLWHVNLGPSVPQPDIISGDLSPEIGITGTPVIDPSSKTLYLVAKTKENGAYIQRLHALDMATGAEKFGGPVVIQASVSGVGDGNDGQGNVPFDPLREAQRGGLGLSNGTVYINWASHGDNGPYHGWIMGYNAQTLQQTLAFNDTPNGGLGGIWMAGGGPAIDSAGILFVSTGNGTYDAALTGGVEFGDTMLKLDPSAQKVVDAFTPFNQGNLSSTDADLGSGGVMLLPDQPGTTPHLLVSAGKEGRVYLVNRDNMGGYHANEDNVVQAMSGVLGGGSFGTPAFFNGRVYYGAVGTTLKDFTLGNTTATTQNVNDANGFTAQGLSLNGSAALSGTRVRLTDGGGSEAGSVWATNPVNISQFTTEFQFQLTNPSADGCTFTLQRSGTGALGASGGDLGYGGIGGSLCIKFDLYSNTTEGADSTGLYTNGQDPFTPATDLTSTGIDFHSGHVFDVKMTYDDQSKQLVVTIKDTTDSTKVATQTYPIDIAATIGGPYAYAGFTGGTGGLTATQDILNWVYTSSGTSQTVTFYGLSSTPTSQSASTFAWPGSTPSISANGAADGIVWANENSSSNCVLHAYNADDLTQELYNSGQAANSRDAVGQYVKFSVPTVAGGKVYIGTKNSVVAFGLIAQPAAQNVTAQVHVTLGGFRYDQVAKQYIQIDTLTNSGATTLAGPLTFVLDKLTATAVLANAVGKTSSAAPAGSPYVIALPSGSLAPGQSVTVALDFAKAGLYTPRVLGGPGSL